MLNIGDKVPDLLGVDENGNEIRVSDYAGRRLVIYFYPKDSTPGCTTEACNIRDNYNRFLAQGYKVYGVSKDSTASHKKFIEKYQLPFPLLSDKSTQMLQDFGAWGEKKMCGKTCIGTIRMTFVFNENGICTDIIDKVDTKNHSEQILK